MSMPIAGLKVVEIDDTDDPLKAAEKMIRNRKPLGIFDKFEMGDSLLAADESLEGQRGEFTRWLGAEFNMSRAAATSLMKIASVVATDDRAIVAEQFDLGALYELTRTDPGRAALPLAIDAARLGEHITAAYAKRLITSQAAAQREAYVVSLPDAVRIDCCDIRDFSVPNDSVDLVFTDPPYDEASVPLYEEVARFARRVLRPGGWCLAYTGKMYLARIHYLMKRHLRYSFQFDVPHTRPTLIQSLAIEQSGKYIVGYRYQPGKPWWEPVSDRVAGAVEKALHKWQQPFEEAEQLVSGLCPKGGVVCDPMCGSGTTLAAALKLGRQVIGADIDEDAIRITKKRLAEVLAELESDDDVE
jgi:predicted RNA methylase